MKTLLPIVVLVALAGVATASPIAISDNNIGDIITVGMNIDANVQSEVNANIANIIAAILIKMGDQQRPPMPPPGPPGPPGPPSPPIPPTPPTVITTPAPPVIPTLPPTDPTFVPPMPAEDLIRAVQEIRQKASVANLSQEQKEQLWRDHAEQFVNKLMANRQ